MLIELCLFVSTSWTGGCLDLAGVLRRIAGSASASTDEPRQLKALKLYARCAAEPQ